MTEAREQRRRAKLTMATRDSPALRQGVHIWSPGATRAWLQEGRQETSDEGHSQDPHAELDDEQAKSEDPERP